MNDFLNLFWHYLGEALNFLWVGFWQLMLVGVCLYFIYLALLSVFVLVCNIFGHKEFNKYLWESLPRADNFGGGL